jgi:hypothetical protein
MPAAAGLSVLRAILFARRLTGAGLVLAWRRAGEAAEGLVALATVMLPEDGGLRVVQRRHGLF